MLFAEVVAEQGRAEALERFICFGIAALPAGVVGPALVGPCAGLAPAKQPAGVVEAGGGLCGCVCVPPPGMFWGMGRGGWCAPHQSGGGMSLERLA